MLADWLDLFATQLSNNDYQLNETRLREETNLKVRNIGRRRRWWHLIHVYVFTNTWGKLFFKTRTCTHHVT